MLVRLTHPETGKSYTVPATQVFVQNDRGEYIAVAFQSNGLIVYGDVTQPDFQKTLASAGVRA